MSALTYHSIMCSTGKKYGEMQWKLRLHKLIRHP
jgi:hypothetical protein